MDQPGTEPPHSHLFLVRVWSDGSGPAPRDWHWHGKVQHVVRGRAWAFDEWPALLDGLLALLDQIEHAAGDPEADKEKEDR